MKTTRENRADTSPCPSLPETIPQLIARNASAAPTRPALRYREGGQWKEINWSELDFHVQRAARALLALGVREGQCVGIFSPNRPDWLIADLAIMSIRAVSVPLYDSDSQSRLSYIIGETEMELIFTGLEAQYTRALSCLGASGRLKTIIAFDKKTRLQGDHSRHFEDFLQEGRDKSYEVKREECLASSSPDDLATIIYTSGTTGDPKGVMLNLSHFLESARAHDQRLDYLSEEDSSLCFLPLSHVFERTWCLYALMKRIPISFCGNPARVMRYLQEARPTVMCAVPRFYEKLYSLILREAGRNLLGRIVFRTALAVGRAYHGRIKEEKAVPFLLRALYRWADRRMLAKIRSLTGGCIRFFPCAGAPLNPEIEAFFHSLGLFILYGYGLTETTATVTCHERRRFRFGTVGRPLPGLTVKIADDGEILVKGPTVMKGYYKKPGETDAVFQDGWFRTGDAGFIADNGELVITDRIKDLMKTSGGKYIAPQALETMLAADPFIEQAVIIAEGRKYVAALIVPDFGALEELARTRGLPAEERGALLKHPDVVKFFRDLIDRRCASLADFERIRRFALLPGEFTLQGSEITPTQKIRRGVILQKYADLIRTLFPDED